MIKNGRVILPTIIVKKQFDWDLLKNLIVGILITAFFTTQIWNFIILASTPFLRQLV